MKSILNFLKYAWRTVWLGPVILSLLVFALLLLIAFGPEGALKALRELS